MKKTSLLLTLFFFACTTSPAQVKKILFLGNSYTYVNNLPELVKQLALSAGDSIYYDSNCPGGYTLQLHSQDATTLAKIHAQPWDYVVIQAQSQEPSLDSAYVAQNVFPYAHFLDSAVHANNPCTQTVFYMTWGRKNGDASNCAAYPAVCTFAGMQQQLRNRYVQMAVDNEAVVAPVGEAWKNCIATNPAFDLYQADESHPSLYGSYLAACVFYSTIYRQASNGLLYYGGLTQAEAALLQNFGSSTVMDSLATWRTSSYYPAAGFTWTNGAGNTVDCTADTNGITSWQWNDGNGSGFVNGSANQSFSYTIPGFYLVTLVVANGCFTDTISMPVVSGPAGIANVAADLFRIYPNPSNGNFRIINPLHTPLHVIIYSAEGQKITEAEFAANEPGTASLPEGLYFVEMTSGTLRSVQKLIVGKNR